MELTERQQLEFAANELLGRCPKDHSYPWLNRQRRRYIDAREMPILDKIELPSVDENLAVLEIREQLEAAARDGNLTKEEYYCVMNSQTIELEIIAENLHVSVKTVRRRIASGMAKMAQAILEM